MSGIFNMAIAAGLIISAGAAAQTPPPVAATPPAAIAPAAPAGPSAPAAPAGGFNLERAKALFDQTCSNCHESSLATSLRNDRDGWREIIEMMIGFEAHITPADADEIAEYLARTYPR